MKSDHTIGFGFTADILISDLHHSLYLHTTSDRIRCPDSHPSVTADIEGI